MTHAFRYRPSLDGIRAIAVLAVIVYHVHEPWLPGGFLGVDVFFVLSGFLITSLLLIEKDSTGRISLKGFWSRRALRLIPAILLLLVTVAVVEHFTLDETAVRAARRPELLATLFYVANWFFIFTGGSYFADYAGASPVRHTWSLAIEEQFYLVFPLAMLVGLKLGRRRLAIALGVIGMLSMSLMAILFDAADPTRAYFGTDARIHQMIVGAVLAIGLASPKRASLIRYGRMLLPLAAVGLAGSFVLIEDSGAFYYRGGAVLVAFLTAVIIAGLEGSGRMADVLSIRPAVGLGKISYGVYLWHFPIVVWLVRAYDLNPLQLMGATLGLTLVVSVLSYTLVERPIRTQRKLIRLRLTPRALAMVVPAASMAVAAFIFLALPDSTPEWAQEASGPETVAVREATQTTVPPVSDTPSEEAGGPVIDRIAVVGDSVMVSSLPGIRSVAADRGLTLVEAAFAACPVGTEPLSDYAGEVHYKAEICVESVTDAYAFLIDDPVDVVLWHDIQSVLPRFGEDGTYLEPASNEWTEALVSEWTRVLDLFLGQGMEVVVLVPPLRNQDADCSLAENPARCEAMADQDITIREATNTFAATVEGLDGVYFLDLDPLLCPDGIPCPAQIDGVTVRDGGTDQTHFTEEGALWFAERLVPLVTELVSGARS